MDVSVGKAIYEEQLAAVKAQHDDVEVVRNAARRAIELALLIAGARTIIGGGLGSLAWPIAVLLMLSLLVAAYIWVPTKPESRKGQGGKRKTWGKLQQRRRDVQMKLLHCLGKEPAPKGWTWWLNAERAFDAYAGCTEAEFYHVRARHLREAFEKNETRLDRLQEALKVLIVIVMALVLLLVLASTGDVSGSG